MREQTRSRGQTERIIAIDDGEVDLDRRVVQRGERAIELRAKEAELLGYLAARAGRTVPREELLSQVFGYNLHTLSRTLDTTIRRLRAAIEIDPSAPRHLETEIGVGYRFVSRVPTSPSQRLLDARVEQVRALLTRHRSARVLLTGPPGCGKRRLAKEVAASFPGRVVHTVGADLGVIAASIGLAGDPRRLRAQIEAQRARSLTLLVLEGLSRDELATFAPPVLGWTVSAPDDPRFEVVPVEPLPRDAALDLLRLRAGGPVHGADDLLDQLGGIPLAIELAAALLAFCTPDELARALASHPEHLYNAASVERASLNRAAAVACEHLDDTSRSALETLSAFVGPADASVMACAAGGLGVLARLRAGGWLVAASSERFVVPTSLRLVPGPQGRAKAASALTAVFTSDADPLCGPYSWESHGALIAALPHLRALSDNPAVRELFVWALHLVGQQEEVTELANSLEQHSPIVYARFSSDPFEKRMQIVEAMPESNTQAAIRCHLLRQAGHLALASAILAPEGAIGAAASELWYQHYQIASARSAFDLAYDCARKSLRACAKYSRLAARARGAVADIALIMGYTSRAEREYRALLRCPSVFEIYAGELGLGYIALSRAKPDAVRSAALRAEEQIHRLPSATAVSAWHQIAVLWRELGLFAPLLEATSAGLVLIEQGMGSAVFEGALHSLLGTGLIDEGRLDEALSELHLAETLFERHELFERRLYVAAMVCAARILNGETVQWPLQRSDGRAGHLLAAFAGHPLPSSRAFATQTQDIRLHAVLDVVVGKLVEPALVMCSFEVRLALALRAHR